MNSHRLTKQGLWDILQAWDEYLRRRVRLVACGGTALTLQDIKPSTKDVDFMVPEAVEYKALVLTIERLGYRQRSAYGWSRGDAYIFDLFPGNRLFMTELLESPLAQGNHIPIKEFRRVWVAVLNDYDLIVTKLFRGDPVDFEDCHNLVAARGTAFDLERLKQRYRETALYDNNTDRVMGHLDSFLRQLEGRDAQR